MTNSADPDRQWRSDSPPATGSPPVGPRTAPGVTAEELAELRAIDQRGRWNFAGRELRVTNLDKVLFPGRGDEQPVTKRELIAYHAAIAPFLVPYLAGRAVNLHRYPDGVQHRGFWHKQHPSHAPGWLRKWHNEDARDGDTRWYTVIDEPAALAWAANYGAIELHPWTSLVAAPREPTWALIDIDPGPRTSWDDLVLLATLHRTALDHLGVTGIPKVTGQRGIQVWIPVAAGHTFEDTRGWVERLSRAIGATVPELVSWQWQTDRRKGLARLDYTQNALNRTLVAPFSARPAPGAPVSVPITWDELDDADLAPDRWTIRSVLSRLEEHGDPLASCIGLQQRLPDL